MSGLIVATLSMILLCLQIVYFAALYRSAERSIGRNDGCVEEASQAQEGWQKGWRKYIYPGIIRLVRSVPVQKWFAIPEKKKDRLKKLYVGVPWKESGDRYRCQVIEKMCLVSWVLLVALCICGWMQCARQGIRTGALLRGEPGEEQTQMSVEVSGKVGGRTQKKEVEIPVKPRRYSGEEAAIKMKEAREYVLKHYLGENQDEQKVSKKLNLMSRIPDSQIRVKWMTDSNGYVNRDGGLNQSQMEQPVPAALRATLYYGELKEILELEVVVQPLKRSAVQQFWYQWKKELGLHDEDSVSEAWFVLPETIGETVVRYRILSKSYWPGILMAGLCFLAVIPVLMDMQQRRAVEERQKSLRLAYPGFVAKLELLVGAGMTVRGAWERMCLDYEKGRDVRNLPGNYLGEEMCLTLREMEQGMPEREAYERFSRRILLLPYMKLMALLLQNMKKGSADLLVCLEAEAVMVLKQRQEMARTLGEEAGTRRMLPMMLMLVVVFAMILIAAFHSM